MAIITQLGLGKMNKNIFLETTNKIEP